MAASGKLVSGVPCDWSRVRERRIPSARVTGGRLASVADVGHDGGRLAEGYRMIARRGPTRREVVVAVPLGVSTLALPAAAAAASGDVTAVPGATLYAWAGSIGDPQLGDAADPGETVWEPTLAATPSGWSAVAVGPTQALGIRDGRLYAWGSNLSGATGLGTGSGDTTTPTEVVVAGVTTWTAVAAGGDNSAGFSTSLAIGDGRLFAFGDNANTGMTGLGSAVTADVLVPTQVGTATDWTAVSAGLYHCLGIRGGELHAWGSNLSGSLGLGSATYTVVDVPTRVGAESDWTTVSADISASSAGIRAGELYTWGSNADGITGLGLSSSSTTTPQRVGSASDWTVASVGFSAAAGIRSGQLHSWGSHTNGVTGQGLTSGSATTPQRVGSETGWSRVAVGPSVMLAIRSGILHAAGATAIGGFAAGSGLPQGTADQATPTAVGGASDWSHVAVSGLDGATAAVGIRG